MNPSEIYDYIIKFNNDPTTEDICLSCHVPWKLAQEWSDHWPGRCTNRVHGWAFTRKGYKNQYVGFGTEPLYERIGFLPTTHADV